VTVFTGGQEIRRISNVPPKGGNYRVLKGAKTPKFQKKRLPSREALLSRFL